MMYEIEWSKKSLTQLENLPNDIQERIINALDRTKIRPEQYFTRLVGDPRFKLKVGKYRVIARIEHEVLKILVVEVGHRKNIYKGL